MALEVYENDAEWSAKQKQAQEQAGNREEFAQVKYKLNLGQTMFRVLGKYKADKKSGWFLRTLEHFEPVGKTVVCPRLYENACPICEKAQEYFDEGNVEMGKKYNPSQRWWVNAIILSEQTPNKPGQNTLTAKDGIYALKLPTSVKSFLLDMDNDYTAGYGNITKLDAGWNVIVDRAQGFRPDAYKARLFAKPTNIVEELANQGVDITQFSMINLDDLVVAKSYEELAEMMEGSAQPEQPTAEPIKLSTVSPTKVQTTEPEAPAEEQPSMTTVKMVNVKPVPNIPKPPVIPGRG